MRAVNLIPADERRGAGGAAGRSGGAVYVVLGGLAAVVLLLALYVQSGKQKSDREAELAQVTQQADAARAEAASLSSFTAFATLRASRAQTITSLADSRFDWSHALREVARVIPADTALSCLRGSVSPTATGSGCTAGDATALRGQRPVPSLELAGCTRSNKAVARLITRLRQVDGVSRVALASAAKPETAGATAGAAGGAVGCRGGDQSPTFSLVVFFEPKSGPGAPRGPQPSAPTGATGAASTTQTTGGTP